MNLFGSSWTETTSTTIRFGQTVGLNQCRVDDTFTNQLSDTVTLFHIKINVRVIEQNNTNISTIVLVDNAGAHINEIFPCQTWTRCYTAICPVRYFNLDVSLHQSFSASWNNCIVCTVKSLRTLIIIENQENDVSFCIIPSQIKSGSLLGSFGRLICIFRQFCPTQSSFSCTGIPIFIPIQTVLYFFQNFVKILSIFQPLNIKVNQIYLHFCDIFYFS